jgi:tagatose 6-phosphate kinase
VILTVTLNTALDLTYRVPRLDVHASHRVREVLERPGGKGLNVARVLAALGHQAAVTGFAGGATGETLRAMLAQERGITDALVPIGGTTRRTLAIADGSSGNTTQLNEPGPHVSPAEWSAFLDAYAGLLKAPGLQAVVLSGSLPPGVPVGAYAQLIRKARGVHVPVVLDTSGEPLRRGLAARPDLVKPNAHELAQVTGTTDPLRAAQAARRRGARAVAASLGADGMLLLTGEGGWRAWPPEHMAGNPTGAGDSAVAGLVSGLAEGLPWPELLARAVALSAATVRAAAAGEFDARTHAELLTRVRVSATEAEDADSR